MANQLTNGWEGRTLAGEGKARHGLLDVEVLDLAVVVHARHVLARVLGAFSDEVGTLLGQKSCQTRPRKCTMKPRCVLQCNRGGPTASATSTGCNAVAQDEA